MASLLQVVCTAREVSLCLRGLFLSAFMTCTQILIQKRVPELLTCSSTTADASRRINTGLESLQTFLPSIVGLDMSITSTGMTWRIFHSHIDAHLHCSISRLSSESLQHPYNHPELLLKCNFQTLNLVAFCSPLLLYSIKDCFQFTFALPLSAYSDGKIPG